MCVCVCVCHFTHLYMYISHVYLPTYKNVYPCTYVHTCNHTYLHKSHKHTINHHIIYRHKHKHQTPVNTNYTLCTPTTNPNLSVCACAHTPTPARACMRRPVATSLTEDHESGAQKQDRIPVFSCSSASFAVLASWATASASLCVASADRAAILG